ncbi:PRC-barrel domain-containing protein [Uliginosibacterium sp. H3]|uniref:PRC-barrel domain-containing protein n=1 Tax=Uliginosibacterium silvisoli TaxID=3114758 RepID=A0ABU6K8H1_9RHOO|nr:PRC-barrel domain-containing protein [Uliginosibacterium sp. H3]
MSISSQQSLNVSGGATIIGSHFGSGRSGPEVLAADTLEGDEVFSISGDKLGKVQNIMLDVPTGRIAYAVLSSGGFLGVGDKLFAIPWSALTLDADRKCFVLDAEKEQLEAAPGFDKDHWPAMADLSWATSIHNYYGKRPYWDLGDE